MKKILYLLFFIFGILIYLIFNKRDKLSIGADKSVTISIAQRGNKWFTINFLNRLILNRPLIQIHTVPEPVEAVSRLRRIIRSAVNRIPLLQTLTGGGGLISPPRGTALGPQPRGTAPQPSSDDGGSSSDPNSPDWDGTPAPAPESAEIPAAGPEMEPTCSLFERELMVLYNWFLMNPDAIVTPERIINLIVPDNVIDSAIELLLAMPYELFQPLFGVHLYDTFFTVGGIYENMRRAERRILDERINAITNPTVLDVIFIYAEHMYRPTPSANPFNIDTLINHGIADSINNILRISNFTEIMREYQANLRRCNSVDMTQTKCQVNSARK